MYIGIEDYVVGASEYDVEESYQHGTLSEIEASCIKGCFLCGFMYYSNLLSDYNPDDSTWEAGIRSSDRIQFEIVARESSRECQIEYTGVCSGTIRVFVAGDIRMPPAETVSSAQLAICTRSSSSFELARSWLNECKTHHHLCQHLKTPLFSESTQNSHDFPTKSTLRCFRDAPSTRRDYKYAFPGPILSTESLLGGIKILRLLMTNIDEMKVGIDVAKLSQTFQDALLITRRLGYKYIWIDSLCIIQDSDDDWRTEAKKMSQIYGNAQCTIAAIGPDGEAGCFRRRNPLLRRPGKLTENSGTPIYGYAFLNAGEYNILEDAPVFLDYQICPYCAALGSSKNA